MFQLIISLSLAVTFFGLRAEVALASTVVTNTSVSNAIGSSTRPPKAADSAAVANDAPTVRCRNIDILSGYPCILSDCGHFRKIDCNGATDRDLRAVFEQYNNSIGQRSGQVSVPSTAAPAPSAVAPVPSITGPVPSAAARVPLVIRLNGGTINLNRGLFSTVSDQLGKMELNQVTLTSGFPEEVFSDLKNLSVLSLNGVLVDRIPAGAFRGLVALQALSLRNLTSLESIQQGALDPIPTNTVFRCLNVNITNSAKFTCDCNTNTWLQRTLLTAAKLNNNGTWSDMYGEPSGGLLPCAIDISCSPNSTAAFRKNIMELNLAALCPVTTLPRGDNVTVAVSLRGDNVTVAVLPKGENVTVAVSPRGDNATVTMSRKGDNVTVTTVTSLSATTLQAKVETAVIVPVPVAVPKGVSVNSATTFTSLPGVVTFIILSGLALL
jgi:Leucine rich repeat